MTVVPGGPIVGGCVSVAPANKAACCKTHPEDKACPKPSPSPSPNDGGCAGVSPANLGKCCELHPEDNACGT